MKRLRETMQANDLDALFVSNPKNNQYLSGFRAMMPGDVQPFGDPEGFLLVQPDRCDFLCDGRYIEGARTLPLVTPQLITSPSSAEVFARKIEELLEPSARTVGFERDALLYADGAGLLDALSRMEWKPAEAVVSGLRLLKGSDEVHLLRKAQDITGDCFEHIVSWIRPGVTEREVAYEIDAYLKTHSEGCSFDPIVAFGESSSHPHYVPAPDRKLEKDQMVMLDIGAVHEGYCGDLTRMICMGKADDRVKEVYDLVLTAQLLCLDGIRPGAACHDLDALCRDTFGAKGCADAFAHGTGHGLGLSIHEDPRIKMSITTNIEAGMVFTVEPGLYFPGWGGVRIEDVVAVTENGYENLTRISKELLELDC